MNVAGIRTSSRLQARRVAAALLVITLGGAAALVAATTADAAIVATVPLGTSANYAVLGASTVTNVGPSTLGGSSLGLSPGSSITGFPPGLVPPPGTVDQTNAAAAQAQSDLTAAYTNAAGRPVDGTTTADLGGLILQGGVYAGPSHGALGLTGPLVLDGAGDPTTVFIFQTNSSLITETGSTVSLINGAQECNVFWQVGSSATLGTGSVFRGNILALTSIDVSSAVTIHGRTLARNGAVTLIDDTFTSPTCDTTGPTVPGPTTPTTGGGGTVTTPTTVPDTTVTTRPNTTVTTRPGTTGTTSPRITTRSLPRTGAPIALLILLAIAVLGVGAVATYVGRTKNP